MGILEDFDLREPTLRDFAGKVQILLEELLSAAKVRVHSISTRAKERGSVAAKIAEVSAKYSDLDQITDLCGARIITYLHDQVEAVSQIVENEFDVDPANSIDKRQTFDPDRFGYVSVHYVVALKKSRTDLAEYRRFSGIKFEIQVRSILQHAWAEIEHDLQYKSKEAIPKQIRRRFARLAGLLELADAEFVGLRNEIEAYQSRLPSEIESSPAAVLVDKDSLTALIKRSSLVASLDNQIAALIGGRLSEDVVSVDNALRALHKLRIVDIGSLERELQANSSSLPRFAALALSKTLKRMKVKKEQGVWGSLMRGASVAHLAWLLLATRIDPAELPNVLEDCGHKLPTVVAEVLMEALKGQNASA